MILKLIRLYFSNKQNNHMVGIVTGHIAIILLSDFLK